MPDSTRQAIPVFKNNVLAQMDKVQQVVSAKLTTLKNAVHAVQGTIFLLALASKTNAPAQTEKVLSVLPAQLTILQNAPHVIPATTSLMVPAI